MHILVTVCYGDNPLYQQELFASVLSVLSQSQGDVEICVFTDQDLSGFVLPVVSRDIRGAMQKSLINGHIAAHLVKEYCLLEAVEHYQQPILFFDTDLFFNAPVDQLFTYINPTNVLMNACEGPVSDQPEWEQLIDYMEKTLQSSLAHPGGHSLMYNSGILGFCPQHSQQIAQSIELTRELYAVDPVFNIEQFCTGAALAEVATVHTCEQSVLHYWGWRRKFVHIETGRFIHRHKGCDVQQLIEAYRNRPIRQQPLINTVDKSKARTKSLLSGWGANYQFAYLCYLSSMRVGINDPQIANAWVQTCLDIVKRSLSDGIIEDSFKSLRDDFKQLFSPIGKGMSWLNQQLKNDIVNLIQT